MNKALVTAIAKLLLGRSSALKSRRLSIHHVLPGLSLAVTLFVFAPVDLYLTSAEDLWFSLADIAPWLGAMALCAFTGITLVSFLLPPKLSAAFRAMVYAGSFLLYLQGNLLVIDYGSLNGDAINWSAYTLRYVLDALLWAVVVALFIFLMLRFRKKFRRIVEIAACVLLVTQLTSLAVFLVRYYAPRQQAENRRYLSVKNEFTVSPENNTIVFVLDSFDSHLFENLRQKYPEKISKDFADFTFYPDTVGGATRTKYAIPFILTGGTNKEEQSYVDYLEKSFDTSPLIRELSSGSYDAGLYTVSHYIDTSRSGIISNLSNGTPVPSSAPRLTLQYMKLVEFRYVPSILARYFWMYTGDFDCWKTYVNGKAAYKLNDVNFYQKLVSKHLKASAGKSAFRFYHLTGPHAPYTMTEQCERVDAGESDEEAQALGTLAIVKEYLSQLRALGLYDRTTMIVMADHGVGHYSNVEQTPLFMVKPANVSHPFEVSDLPLSYTSMPEILVSALRGELTSLESWRASSPRYFYCHSEKGTVVNITEYSVSGQALESDAEPTGAAWHENTLHLSRDYTPGTVLYFDERDTARSYLVSGFSSNEAIYTWTSGNNAEMTFDLSESPGALLLTITCGAYGGEQAVEVFVNDQLIDTLAVKSVEEHSVLIPAGIVNGTELRLRLHLPDARSPFSLGKGVDHRLLGLNIFSMAISAE